ncbi:hypothetical protein EDC01DRAFT_675727 [Geopyxis carbonaria]|nr:hypothetical protein EDC01DRAFT_675727 [Geopyxis carbonaria]
MRWPVVLQVLALALVLLVSKVLVLLGGRGNHGVVVSWSVCQLSRGCVGVSVLGRGAEVPQYDMAAGTRMCG